MRTGPGGSMNSVIIADRKVRFGATLRTAFLLFVRNLVPISAFCGLGTCLLIIVFLENFVKVFNIRFSVSLAYMFICFMIVYYFGLTLVVVVYRSVQNFHPDIGVCLGVVGKRIFAVSFQNLIFISISSGILYFSWIKGVQSLYWITLQGVSGLIVYSIVKALFQSLFLILVSFSSFACLLENLGPCRSIGRASQLLWGNWSRIICIVTVPCLLLNLDDIFGYTKILTSSVISSTILSLVFGVVLNIYVFCVLIAAFAQLRNYHDDPDIV